MTIQVRTEGERGCGYRKAGGLYLMGGAPSAPCGRLPLPLDVCPVCKAGIKPTRGWTWIDPRPLFVEPCNYELGAAEDHTDEQHSLHRTCPLADHNLPERAGLLWIGEQFYDTPATFLREAQSMGVSRRITAVPRNFKLGEDTVLLAHRKTICVPAAPDSDDGDDYTPGIFMMFKPTAIEYVVRDDDTQEKLDELEARGIQPVRIRRAEQLFEGEEADTEGGEP